MKSDGFTLLEVMVALGMLGVFIMMGLSQVDTANKSAQLTRTVATRDRILSGVRTFAGMPAALRNSLRASQPGGLTPVNPQLLDCTTGATPNHCQNDVSYPFTLYSPIVALSPTGVPTGIRPITSPLGSSSSLRFDTFGAPCTQSTLACPFEVFTSFKAHCGPAALPSPTPAVLTADLLVPMATCTVADLIEVVYQVQLDPALASAYPAYGTYLSPVSGSISTSVLAIVGNSPQ